MLDGSIYAIGGYDGRWRMRSTERYDPEGNQWNKVSSLHNRRSDAGAAAMSGMQALLRLVRISALRMANLRRCLVN